MVQNNSMNLFTRITIIKGGQVYENNLMWQVKLIQLNCLRLKVKS